MTPCLIETPTPPRSVAAFVVGLGSDVNPRVPGTGVGSGNLTKVLMFWLICRSIDTQEWNLSFVLIS